MCNETINHLVDFSAHVLVPKFVFLAEGEILRRSHKCVTRILTQKVAVVLVAVNTNMID